MSFSNKIDIRTLSLVLIALIGGVIGGYISNATISGTRIEGLSNALTTQLSSKDTEIATLRDTVSMLEARVIQFEGSIVGFNTPDYDSGWIEVGPMDYVGINHNLGTRSIFVYLLGGWSFDDVHQMWLGGEVTDTTTMIAGEWVFSEHRYGVYWRTAGENSILVSIVATEEHRNDWSRIRALIWVLPDPPG